MTETINIHFGGAGGHYSYLLGIASILQKKFKLDNVHFSGVSAGCIPALFCTLNLNIDEEFETLNINMLKDLQSYRFKAFFNFLPTLEIYLKKRINKNDKFYHIANKRFSCYITHIPSFSTKKINNFNNNNDLIKCLISSGHIPIYNNSLFATFRNKYYVDGDLNKDIILKKNTIHITRTRYRKINTSRLFISSCDKESRRLFNLGKIDALKNLSDFNLLEKKIKLFL